MKTKSWRTTTLGIIAILYALWVAHVTYVPSNTARFNILYVWPAPIALLFIGWGLIHARDHRCQDSAAPPKIKLP